MTARIFRGLVAILFLLGLGCKDVPGTGGTTGVALYAFDSTTSQVMVWSDVSAMYDNATTPAPTYQFSHSLLTKVTNLAWGGMCLDAQRGVLYMVAADSGTIIRMSNIRSQTGTIPTADIASFQLDTSSRLTNGSFGQAAIDSQSDSLFITESGDNGTRIWVVTSASQQSQSASITLNALQSTGNTDTAGTGVAVNAGIVYAYMNDGSPVGPDFLTGPCLRKGTSASFAPSLVILGNTTGLGVYGTLALDSANGYLFVGRHNTDASATSAPILAYQTGQFGSSFNQAPAQTLGSATDQATLRVLSHAGTKDWLVGLRGQGSTGYPDLILWKSPLGGTAAVVKTVSGSVFKGVALDGNAS